MAGGRVYIHELVDILGHHRADYLQHVTANWGPIGRTQRGQRCFGVWATVGSTGRWPQVVNLWEYADWDALARNFEVELTGDGLQDPALEEWWAAAAAMRSGGTDRLLVAADWSPSIDELCAEGRRAHAGYVHETIRVVPGGAAGFLDLLGRDGIAPHEAAGLTLVGAFRRAMAADDEVIVVWSFAEWAAWAAHEAGLAAARGEASEWRAAVRADVTTWEGFLMADAPLSPLRTGRQPEESDRRPLGSSDSPE